MAFFASRRLATAAVALSVAACGQEGRAVTSGTGGTSSTSASSSSVGSGGSGGSLPVAKPLRILNWNTHNFLNDKNDSSAPDEVVISSSQYTAHRKAVGAVISALDPDIAVLAEVENTPVLEDLDATELGGAYSGVALVDGNDPRGIDVGVLSKVALGDVVSHKDETFTLAGTGGPPYQYSRDCLEVHLVFNGRPIVLLAVHFKAKTPPDDPDKRLAEAQHTRAIADALAVKDPGTAIVILGDYNDVPGSPAYLAIAGAQADTYVDAADSAPEADRWTFDFNGKLELVDHQMQNPLLYERLDAMSVVIPHGGDVDAASDHAPMMATYEVN